MNGFTAEELERAASPAMGGQSLEDRPGDVPSCDRCCLDLTDCVCRVEDTTAVALLRDVVLALRALPWSSPVPLPLVTTINRAEDYLRHYHPEDT